MRLILLLAGAAALAAGCATPASNVDANFGRAVEAARAVQVIDPDAPSRARAPKPVADGQAAKSAIDRYQKSFDAPPATVNVLNIGIGGTSSQ